MSLPQLIQPQHLLVKSSYLDRGLRLLSSHLVDLNLKLLEFCLSSCNLVLNLCFRLLIRIAKIFFPIFLILRQHIFHPRKQIIKLKLKQMRVTLEMINILLNRATCLITLNIQDAYPLVSISFLLPESRTLGLAL